MIRWSYVIPRLLVVALLVAALAWGVEPAARWAGRYLGLASIGRPAEFGAFQVAWRHGRVTIEDLRLGTIEGEAASPLSLKSATLEVDPAELLHRRYVVKKAEAIGLELDVDRLDQLLVRAAEEADDDAVPAPHLALWTDDLRREVDDWLRGAANRLSDDLTSDLESPPLAEQIAADWQAKWQSLRDDAQTTNASATELVEELRGAAANPLRRLSALETDLQRVEAIKTKAAGIRSRLTQLRQSAQQDLSNLDAARLRDMDRLKNKAQLEHLDGELLGRVLVGEQISGPMHWIGQLVHAARAAAPYLKNRWRPKLDNALHADFAPQPAPADFLVRQARASGRMTSGDRVVPFDARVSSATWQMDRTGEPLDLSASIGESQPVQVAGRLDYRDPTAPRETVAWKQSGRSLKVPPLGDRDTLELAMDGVAVAAGKFDYQGDHVTGRIRFAANDTSLQVASNRGELAEAAKLLRSGASAIDAFNADVQFEGDLEQLALTIQSDLGDRIAAAANQTLRQEAARRLQAAETLVGEEIAAARQMLAAELEQQSRELADLVAAGEGRLASVATFVASKMNAQGDAISGALRDRLR